MSAERIVDRLDSVFDLRIHKALNLAESVSIRVMLTYNKTENRTNFKVVSTKTTGEINKRITSWMDANVDVEDIICHLGSKEIDMDTLPRASSI